MFDLLIYLLYTCVERIYILGRLYGIGNTTAGLSKGGKLTQWSLYICQSQAKVCEYTCEYDLFSIYF